MQTRLCLLFDISMVYMTSLRARNGFIEYPDFSEKKIKNELHIIVDKLKSILDVKEDITEFDLWPLYQRCIQLWNQFFDDFQQRWTVCLINDDDEHWRFIYIHLKELVQNVHLLSYRMPDY